MRGILKAYGADDRKVFVADSFAGLPTPDTTGYPQDSGDSHYTLTQLAVSLEEVQANFRRYGLLDEQVHFLKGWFADTLPTAPIERLAVIRMDGDMYGSTMDAFVNLYPKLSTGGYVIIDDVGAVPGCQRAVEDYRRQQNISEEIHQIDWTGVYWQKTK
jgi:O-methyltransferase